MKRPIPDDFHLVAQNRTLRQLEPIYHAGRTTILRWRREAGLERPKKAAKPKKATVIVFRGQTPPRIPPRDWTLHGCAAEHLRKYAATYRCTETGQADQHGEFYRYGNAVLTPDELLRRAERLGWERERWAA